MTDHRREISVDARLAEMRTSTCAGGGRMTSPCPTAVLLWGTGLKEALANKRKGPLTCGGAKGTRTPNPLLAKQVRYQLRHGPENTEPARTRRAGGIRDETSRLGGVRGLRPEPALGLLGLDLTVDRQRTDGRRDEEEDLLHGGAPPCE